MYDLTLPVSGRIITLVHFRMNHDLEMLIR
jgi:hypothetical protein